MRRENILFSLQHCIKAYKIIFRVYLLALKEICWSEMKWNNREKLIQFDLNQWSLKYLLFIRWNMMIKWNVHIHEAWHTLVSILNIYFKLMEKKPQHQTLSSLSNTLVHAIALASSRFCWIHTNLFMTLTTFTTKMCNVLLVRMRLTHINMQMESTGHFTGWWKRKKNRRRDLALTWRVIGARQHLTKNTENKKIRYPFELEHPQNG